MNKSYNIGDKSHYVILDGLRGVAALLVVWYHVFEGFAFAQVTNGAGDGIITTFNHGYLAVDFFFMLSGFVISYAYDDRWKKMSLGQFFKRRLLRLHPMVIIGALVGTIAFCIGGCTNWSGEVAQWYNILLAAVLGMLLIPAIPGCSYDVRGNGEMFPLNGPSWSLFFEYIGNVIYALIIRKLSAKWLKITVIIMALLFGAFAVTDTSGYGSIGVGWTLDKINFAGGLLRMLFPFTLGMLIRRRLFSGNKSATGSCKNSTTARKSGGAQLASYLKGFTGTTSFIISSLLLFIIFSVPFLGSDGNLSRNGIFEFCAISIIFPIILIMGAGAAIPQTHKKGLGIIWVTSFFGRLSYPLYIVHYPVMYLFYSWLIKEEVYTLSQGWTTVAGVIAIILIIAYLALKFYEFIEAKIKKAAGI